MLALTAVLATHCNLIEPRKENPSSSQPCFKGKVKPSLVGMKACSAFVFSQSNLGTASYCCLTSLTT